LQIIATFKEFCNFFLRMNKLNNKKVNRRTKINKDKKKGKEATLKS